MKNLKIENIEMLEWEKVKDNFLTRLELPKKWEQLNSKKIEFVY